MHLQRPVKEVKCVKLELAAAIYFQKNPDGVNRHNYMSVQAALYLMQEEFPSGKTIQKSL